MAKFHPTFYALGVIAVTATLAQQPSAVVPPSSAPARQVTPITPAEAGAVGTANTIVPAPIEPPLLPTTPQEAVPPVTPNTAAFESDALPPETTVSQLPPSSARLNEFQGDEIGLVLRTLARQAGVTIIVTDKVSTTAGTVTARIENKTPMQAIGIIADSKGLIMEEREGVLYVKTQEEKAQEPTESASFTLSYAKASDILPLLQSQLQSGLAPQLDVRTNTVFFREAKSNIDKILLFLATVDQPTQQVMIEARLVEVTANPQQSFGINWGGVFGGSTNAQTVRFGGSLPAVLGTPSTGPLGNTQVNTSGSPQLGDLLLNGQTGGGFLDAVQGQFAILSAPQLSATLRLLNEDRDSEFLANPRVVTANNQKAEIKITRNQPVPQLNFNEQTAQAVFSGFQDKEFGNTLEVTPSINKDGFVTLNVKPEISNKVADATFTFSGAVVTSPIIDKRTLNSNVLIKSGDTLAIGGLLQDEQTKSRTKVPILGDLPLIGYAFQEKINVRTKRNLLVFVTPTVIKQGYGTGLEDQVSGLNHSGEEYADPNGWRNNAKGAIRLVPTSNRQRAADYPKPGMAKAPKRVGYRASASGREK
jgi:type IV pilus assembly protein PilQ